MIETDVIVIGAGPGGYPAAIRAAQLGKQVIVIDKGFIGGECLNWGCIPSKALISAATYYYKMQHEAAIMGINAKEVTVDVATLQNWKQSIQTKLIDGIKQLFKVHKIKTIIGTARFVAPHRVAVTKKDGSEEIIRGKDIIIGTGASFISLPGFEIDERQILSAKGALSLQEIPKHLVCIGGGVIGLELGTVYAKLGAKVSIVELMPQVLPGIDKRMVAEVKKQLKKIGVDIYTSSKATKLERTETEVTLTVETKKGEEVLHADKILLSIGKKAVTEGLNLEASGVATDKRGFIIKDTQMRTNVEGIYAVGDCTGIPFLAHRATKEGIIAAEVIAGKNHDSGLPAIPGAIFTDPEIAMVGMSEDEAKEAGYSVVVSRAPFAVSGRAMSQLEEKGFVKLIAEQQTGKILGVQIVGPHASDLISEGALAITAEVDAATLGFTSHPHPTLPEMIMEAAEALEGKAIHIPNAKNTIEH